MLTYRRGCRYLAPLVALALLAGACGSSGGDDASTEADGNILDENTKEKAQEAIESTSTTAAAAADKSGAITSMDDYEALWTTERAAIVKRIIAAGGWDKATSKVTGPGGFTMDLSKCPAGWDPYGGLENNTISIGETLAQSGIAADYGNIGIGQQIYYDYINSQGGIKDSEGKTYTIQTTIRDDAYDVAKTVPLVDELVDSAGVFAMETMGSPNTMKVYGKLNANCIPQPYVLTGHPAWGDPVNHPWTWGHQMAYTTEAILWGGLIEKEFADKDEINVAALIMQNDFGKAYEDGFKTYIAGSKKKINFEFERIDPTAPTITNQMTTLAAKKPDVFIAMTGGTSCTQAITDSANNGLKASAKMLFQPSVCKGLNFIGKEAVGDDGSASNGWWIVGGGAKDFNDSANVNDPWIAFARDLLEKAGHPSKDSSQLGNGFAFGFPMVQALLIAADLPGGVSRPNLVLAARSLDMTNPNLLKGIGYNMAGNEDPYPTEGSEFAVFDGAKQTWVTNTELGIIELSGSSAPCAWDQSAGVCG